MDAFLSEWINLLLRWAHLIVGIGWIGTSFYFVALDYSLDRRERKSEGVYGTAWQVHGGGFYHVEKFTVAPPHLPAHLHWFRWEAYLTWLTGVGLLMIQYYWHAGAYLIDPSIKALTPWQAIGISLVSLGLGWAAYEGLCRSRIGHRPVLLALLVFGLIVGEAAIFTNLFSGRGAFIHVGALTGTIMAANVFMVIIPNQKKMVAQMLRGQAPDPLLGAVGKQRSLHNNYLTLPVLVMMVSPHYAFLFGQPHAWLVVALILISGGLIRHYLNRADAGDDWHRYGWAAGGAAAVLMAVFLTAPRPATTAVTASVTDADVLAIVSRHCTRCHARKPTHDSFQEAPKGIMLETIDQLRQYAPLVFQQTVINKAMPLGNETGITDEERAKLGQWAQERQ